MLSVIYSDRSSSFLSLWSRAVSSLLSGSATQLLFFFPVTMFYFCKWQLILFCVSLFSFHDVLFFFLVFQFLLLCLLIFSNVHYFLHCLTYYFSISHFRELWSSYVLCLLTLVCVSCFLTRFGIFTVSHTEWGSLLWEFLNFRSIASGWFFICFWEHSRAPLVQGQC